METSVRRLSTPHFRRPLLPLVLMYGTGVVVGPLLPFGPLLLLCVLFLLLGTAGLALWTNRRILATILVLLGFLFFGSLRWLQSVHPQERFHLSKVSDASLTEKVEIEGIIVSPPEIFPPGGGWRREGRVRFLLQVEEINLEGVRYPATGGARLSIIAPVQEYQYGHRIRGNFRLRRPRGYWNPGAFVALVGLERRVSNFPNFKPPVSL